MEEPKSFKPLITVTIGGVKVEVRFEHNSPKRIKAEHIKHTRPGTICFIDILPPSAPSYTIYGRSFLHKGDKFNGNIGMLHALDDALISSAFGREARSVIFAELKSKIAHGMTPKMETINVPSMA